MYFFFKVTSIANKGLELTTEIKGRRALYRLSRPGPPCDRV